LWQSVTIPDKKTRNESPVSGASWINPIFEFFHKDRNQRGPGQPEIKKIRKWAASQNISSSSSRWSIPGLKPCFG